MLNFPTWKIVVIALTCLLGVVYAAPNLLEPRVAQSIPNWLPHRQISLGLDLQGGSHLLLEVDVNAVLRERQEAIVDGLRSSLREARINYSGLGVQGQSVVVVIRDADRVSDARSRLRDLDREATIVVQEGNRLISTPAERSIRDRKVGAVEQSMEIVRRRIDETGVREPTIQRQGEDRILVQLPGIEDPDRIKRLLGKTAKMTFHLVDDRTPLSEAMAGRVPPGTMLLPSANEAMADGSPRMFLVRRAVAVSGDSLVDAQPSFDQRTGEPIVSFRFDASGARRFGDVTKANVGHPFAIVLDDKVISAPVIREPILGGSGQISGNFTVASAQELALLLRAGALPAPLAVLEERTVGPGLGADSIEAGKLASLVASVGVVIFMIAAYGFFGLLANVALVFNIIFIFAVMSVLGATLTLPGIAGIALTVGMAVDANILVFERIREEVRAGRSPISAIDAGYARAMGTIIDSNLTTLIAAFLLYVFGSGPVRGFAVTLSVGIMSSMFTAISLVRLFTALWVRRRRPQALPI